MTNREQNVRRHGLPSGYSDGLAHDQAKHAVWKTFDGPTPQTVEVRLVPGQLYEFWPGGDVFNASGTYLGSFQVSSAPHPCADDEHAWYWCSDGQPPTAEGRAWQRCWKCGAEPGREAAEGMTDEEWAEVLRRLKGAEAT